MHFTCILHCKIITSIINTKAERAADELKNSIENFLLKHELQLGAVEAYAPVFTNNNDNFTTYTELFSKTRMWSFRGRGKRFVTTRDVFKSGYETLQKYVNDDYESVLPAQKGALKALERFFVEKGKFMANSIKVNRLRLVPHC